jgi:putative membrane protein
MIVSLFSSWARFNYIFKPHTYQTSTRSFVQTRENGSRICGRQLARICGMQEVNGEGNVWKGLVAGLAAGFVASWTMNQFQAAWTRLTENFEKPHGAQSLKPSEGPNPNEVPLENEEQQDDATVEVAKLISKGVFGHELKESEQKPAGAAVHYAFGTVTGGLYGAMAEVAPQITSGAGLPFGAAFWLVADETVVPLTGLAKSPTEYPLSTHAYALAAHLVYGLTAEFSRRAVRRIL